MKAFRSEDASPVQEKLAAARKEMSTARKQLSRAHVDLSRTFKLQVVDGWTDWDTAVQLMVNQLRAIGLKVQYDPLQFGAYLSNLQLGH